MNFRTGVRFPSDPPTEEKAAYLRGFFHFYPRKISEFLIKKQVQWINNGFKGDNVYFECTVNGKTYTIKADRGGNCGVTNKDTLATLNAIYDAQTGTKSDVVYYPKNGKVYYYYADSSKGDRLWVEIKAKADGKGEKAEDEDLYIAAIAAYMSRPGNGPRNARERPTLTAEQAVDLAKGFVDYWSESFNRIVGQ